MANTVFQLQVTLRDIEPPVWRRIMVPDTYSFWDLHVALQDAMGWLDTHPHSFRVPGLKGEIGVPDEDNPEQSDVTPDWTVKIADYLKETGVSIEYEYDFGDSWIHDIVVETRIPAEKEMKYPACTDGKRACPPEDCGGMPGYLDIVEKMKKPRSKEYKEMVEWLGGKYDPEAFNCGAVSFDDPKKRWKMAFEDQQVVSDDGE